MVVAVPHHHPCAGVAPPHALHALPGRTGRVCGLRSPPIYVVLHCPGRLCAPRGWLTGCPLVYGKLDGFPWHKQNAGPPSRVPPAARAPARSMYFM